MINYSDAINTENVKQQYSNSEKLSVRRNLHTRYSTSKIDMNEWLVSMYPLGKETVLLELGSGEGTLWENGRDEKLNNCKSVVLSDYSEYMVTMLKKKFENRRIVIEQIDIMDIPYKDQSMDIVIANSMLYHVNDINKALEEVYRVLKPEGIFFASTFGQVGLMEYIYKVILKAGIPVSTNHNYTFTLQNGEQQLKKKFNEVCIKRFDDNILLYDIEPLYEYIMSMTIIENITVSDARRIKNVLYEECKKEGKILIKKEYGTFIARKTKDTSFG